MICYACNYYLFSTEDPFHSIGWEQPDFFALLVNRTFAAGYFREDISRLLIAATTGGLSRECLHIQQEAVLLEGLKTKEAKSTAREEAEKLAEERSRKLEGLGKYDNQRYDLEDEVDELCGMALLLSIRLEEADRGIKFYFQYSGRKNKETALFRALRLMEWTDENELWIKIYEYGLKKKITPRDRLQDAYKMRKGID